MNTSFLEWILFEDNDLVVVDKPAMMPSLAERHDAESENVLAIARRYFPEAQLCHRLDRETSGAMVIAKNNETFRYMASIFEKRLVAKTYHAISYGIFYFENLCVDYPLYTDSKRKVYIDKARGKESRTIFNAIRNYKHYTLIECIPETGRLHQIRVHLATQNASIAGDKTYGGKIPFLSELKKKFKSKEEESPMIGRVALHAFKIEFKNSKGEVVSVEAPYPKDFMVFLKLLERWD